MEKNLICKLLITFILLVLTACSTFNSRIQYDTIGEVKLNKEAKVAMDFLQVKGYKVIAYSKEASSSYVLTKEKLNDPQDHYERNIWALQGISGEQYVGKVIFDEKFLVTNHPLDTFPRAEGNTSVDVLIVEGRAIGGISAPNTTEALVGMPYTLDGKTLDQLKKEK